METVSFTEYFKTQTRIVFVSLSSLLIGINISHFFPVSDIETPKLILDNTISILLIVTLVAHFRFKANLKICAITALYLAVVNILFTHFVQDYKPEEAIYILLKNNIYYTLLLILAGIIIHKTHAIVLLCIILIEYAYTGFIDKLKIPHGYILYIILFAVITAIIYFFSEKIHEAIKEIHINQRLIKDKNNNLNNTLEELQALTEDQQAKNKRLQEMILSRDKFFSIISHDIKSPLNTIIGFVELMQHSKNKISEEKQQYYLSLIEQSGKNLSKLITDLLEWSRSKANISEAKPEDINARELAESVYYFLTPLASEKKIRIKNNVNNNHLVFADYNMLFTILRNLVSNAIKFSHKKTIVTINSEENENVVKFIIEDQGVGIDEETRKKIFQLGSNTSTKGTNNEIGTGLGLMLCKEFVKKNNGSIGVESEIGKGSRFWFTMPKSDKEV